MPEEQKGLIGQICYPSRNFPIRLTEVTPALNLPCAFLWDHRCFVTCSSCYGLDSSLSSEMVLNSSEMEHGVTYWYVPTIRLREGESICLFSTYIYSEKCQNSSAISGTWAGERETTMCSSRVPLNTNSCFPANTEHRTLLQKQTQNKPGQTCLIFHIPSNLSASITGGSEIQWNKSDVRVYEGSSAEDVVFLHSAWFLYLRSYSSPQS